MGQGGEVFGRQAGLIRRLTDCCRVFPQYPLRESLTAMLPVVPVAFADEIVE
jgi:hypothetical protein